METNMQQYRLQHTDRRDSHMDSNGSTPYQQHQSLGGALGTHLPGLGQNGSHPHPGPQTGHSPLFSVQSTTSPAMKRKAPDNITDQQKRRRNTEDAGGDNFDDGNSQGAKHWTDEEKTSLFKYLMGPEHDEHWAQLRATKNFCLRECATHVFGGRKTYQALKGCYERNFNLFKQIYAFETFNTNNHSPPVTGYGEADRLREFERRLQAARKANCDVGNLNARTIDHWHRIGWYELFYRRWHGDPSALRQGGRNGTVAADGDDQEDDTTQINFTEPLIVNNMTTASNGTSGNPNIHPTPDHSQHISFVNPQTLREPAPPPPPISPMVSSGTLGGGTSGGTLGATSSRNIPTAPASAAAATAMPPPPATPTGGSASASTTTPAPGTTALPDSSSMMHLVIPAQMLQAYLQNMQTQTQAMKMKMEYLRRREEREEKESNLRREAERIRLERETAEHEAKKQVDATQRRTDQALSLVQNERMDASVRQVAGDYLKRLFTDKH